MDKSKQIVNREVIQSYLMTTARYNFTLTEKRVLIRIITNLQSMLEGQKLEGKIERDLWDNLHIIAPIGEYMDGEQNYKLVRDAFFSLNEKKYIYQDENVEEVIRIVEMPKIYKRGYIEYTLNPKIVDCFLNYCKGYTKYDLAVALSLNSVYSIRLYEILSHQEKPLTFKIDTLKEMFALSEKYPRNNDFIKYIVENSRKELDEKSPYTFDYAVIKSGRAFHSIRFIPKHQEDKEDESIKFANVKRQVSVAWIIGKELRDYLKNTCGFTDREIKNNDNLLSEIENTFGEVILEKIREVWTRARKASNPKGYLIGTLKQMLKEQTI